MEKILEAVTQEVSRVTGREVNKQIVRNALLYVTASMMGLSRIYLESNGTKRYANFFGIRIAPSGDGKDKSLDIAEKNSKELENE